MSEAQIDIGIPASSQENEANGGGAGNFVDVKPHPLKNLPFPWKNRLRFDPHHHQLKPHQEFLEKCTEEFIAANLGQVLEELATLTPTISNCFAKSPEIFHKVSVLFRTLMRSKNRRPRIMSLAAMEEVLASLNWHATSLLAPYEEEGGVETVFTILMSTLLTSKNVDVINGALQCVLRLLCSESTWEATTNLLFDGEEPSLIHQLSEACANEDQMPVMMVEGCRILITLATFCNTAKRLKEIYRSFEENHESVGEFFFAWESLEEGFSKFSEALKGFQQETFIREYSVFTVLETCELLPSLRLLLLLNLKHPSLSPPNPLSFLNRLISISHGLLFLTRLPQIDSLLNSLILLANEEASAEMSNFDASIALVPSARGILERITTGWKVLAFCDTLKVVRGNVEKAISDDEVLNFLDSLKRPAVRREFSKILGGGGYLNFLLDGLAPPKDEKTAKSDYKLQLLISLVNIAVDGANEEYFWLENAERMYLLLKSKDKNALIDVPDIHDSPLGTFLRDSAVDSCEVAKWTASFASNLSRLSYTGLSEAQIARIHLIEFMCPVESGRMRSLAVHSLLANNIDTVVETKLKEQLAVALPLFQAGMADCSGCQRLLLRFSLPALRILGYCMNIDPEVSVLSPALISYLLGLWTLSSDLNGQSPDNLATDTKIAIFQLLQKNLFRQTTSSATVVTTLIGKGSETPLYFSSLLELLMALLPPALPMPIAKRDLNKGDKFEEEHAASVKSWVENIESLRSTKIAEVLLCAVPYVHGMSKRLLERIVSYENEELAGFFARAVLDYVGMVLQGDGYQQGSTAVPVSDDEKEQKEEESMNKSRASSAHARLMETFSALSSIQGFHTAIARALTGTDGTLSTMLSLSSRPWENSKRQATYQDYVLEFIHCVLSGMTEWKLQAKGNQETENVLVQALRALLNFLVDKEQCPASVSKAVAVLYKAVEKDPRKGHQLAHLFSDGLFAPLFRQLLAEPSQEICSAASTVAQVLISLTPSDPALIRSAAFDPKEEGKQPLAQVFDMIESNGGCGDEGDGIDAICELYLLAADGEGKQADLARFNADIPSTEESRPKPIFRLAHTDLQVLQEKRRLAGKKDVRLGRGTRIGSDVAEAVRTYSDNSMAMVVQEFFAKREKSETKTKIDPFSQPARLKWA